ncbi:MAG: Rpn family recombination-promoting nuclease/putative transposase [Myxococcota bacterium]
MYHDRLFKQLMRSDFPGFVQLFFPSVFAQTDFSTLEWLDKEFFADLPKGAVRTSDLVAKVMMNGEESLTFLFLTELESYPGQQVGGQVLGERLFQYYSLLWNRYRLPVFPVVVYIVESRVALEAHTHKHTLFGYVTNQLHYQVVGLPKLSAEDYLKRGTLMAGALGASMSPGQWSRAELKLYCLETVARAPGNEAQKFVAVNHIETYLELSDDEAQQFDTLLMEEKHVEAQEVHLTWADKLILKGRAEGEARGEARGEAKGEVNGIRRTLARQLERKFGLLSPAVLARLGAISPLERLDALAEQVLTASSLRELGLE